MVSQSVILSTDLGSLRGLIASTSTWTVSMWYAKGLKLSGIFDKSLFGEVTARYFYYGVVLTAILRLRKLIAEHARSARMHVYGRGRPQTTCSRQDLVAEGHALHGPLLK